MITIEQAERFAPDRTVTLGVVGLRPVVYVGEGIAASPAALPGLVVRSLGVVEVPTYHGSTGLYGFLRLPPGPRRFHITDLEGRYLPRAWQITGEGVPDRSAVRDLLASGAPIRPGLALPRPAYATVPMRAAIDLPLPPGSTAVRGQVIDSAGRALPFARLTITTRFDGTAGTVVTHSDLNGSYVARLSGERATLTPPPAGGGGDDLSPPPDLGAASSPEVPTELRAIVVHRLKAEAAARDIDTDPLASFPADFDTLDPDNATGPYQPVVFTLHDPITGTIWRPPEGSVLPQLAIQVGRIVRRDVVVT